ncbi:MAG: Stealth CR1 domain-containing protein, partial [Micromonosporaceae bacterium]|nr:Stealth CR1 domain-containing protein [Micromonosporaceae bacterium]
MSTATTPKAQPQHRSVTLRVYQRIVPLRWRLAVRQTMPPGMKAAVARRLAYGGASRRLVEAVVGGLASLRHRRLLRNPEHCLVRAEGRFRVALVRPEASPTAARRETLDVVLRTLTAADLPFFCVRGYDDRRSVVAIDAVHRSVALDALAAACRDTPGYLARIVHDVTDLLDGLWPARRGATMVRRASVVRLVRFYCDPARLLVLGPEYGCDLEMWSKVDGMLVAPRPNRAADEVQPDGPTVLLDESAFVRTPLPGSTRTYPTRPECVGTLLDEITFPIDAVYTWVDGSDPHWRARRDAARGLADTGLHAQAANDSR